MKKGMIIGCMILGFLAFTGSVEARYDYELAYGYSGRDSEARNAVAMDDWLERGRAAVMESPLFPDGVRLTAEGGEGADEAGLASAIYYFNIPPGAQYLTIKVRYSDTARDDQIAGRLWIKSSDNDMGGEPGAGEEAPLYGDTFVLRSERSSESITVPTSRHVEGGTLELHIVAQGTDCIDVRDIQVEYLYTKPQITVVHRTCDDYWDRWPRHRYAYHYFYWGPLFWPRTYIVYECWDVPVRFYWVSWRPWFFINIVRVHHHRPWWGPRRYTVVYHVDRKQPPHKRRPLLRERLKERHPHVTPTIRQKHLAGETVPRPLQIQSEPQQKEKGRGPHVGESKRTPNPIQQHPKERSISPHNAPRETVPRPLQIQSEPQQKEKERGPHLGESKRTPNPIQQHPKERSISPHNAPGKPTVPTQTKTVAPERIHQDQRQPHTVKQPRSKPVTRETVREETKAQAGRDYGAQREPTVQRQVGSGHGATSQSHGAGSQPQRGRSK